MTDTPHCPTCRCYNVPVARVMHLAGPASMPDPDRPAGFVKRDPGSNEKWVTACHMGGGVRKWHTQATTVLAEVTCSRCLDAAELPPPGRIHRVHLTSRWRDTAPVCITWPKDWGQPHLTTDPGEATCRACLRAYRHNPERVAS